MEYKEQIKLPQWQRRRLEILQRDDFTCQICGCKDKTLHVHHLRHVPGREIHEYEDWELIPFANSVTTKSTTWQII